jgi:ribosome-associated protein
MSAALCHGPGGGPAARLASRLAEVTELTGQVVTGAADTQTAKAPRAAARGKLGSEQLLSLIISSLDQDGAEEILEIPLAGKSAVADFMVVASGRSTRHVAALSENLVDRLKHDAGVASRVEGKEAADWVLIDAGDIIVHVFRPEVREFYQLEKMWLPAPDKTARPA